MFVTLEGPEGAGKSTIASRLAAAVNTLGRDVFQTREPGSGPIGVRIREILLEAENPSPACELFLFLADRAQHVETLIRPALASGKVVICDRFTDSTLAYQGYGRNFDLQKLRDWNTFATGGLKPDLTLLFDLSPELGLSRIGDRDRLDREPLEFHKRVHQGFLSEISLEPDRWILIDASQDVENVYAQCWAAVREKLGVQP